LSSKPFCNRNNPFTVEPISIDDSPAPKSQFQQLMFAH
jgi:hypothetical protein